MWRVWRQYGTAGCRLAGTAAQTPHSRPPGKIILNNPRRTPVSGLPEPLVRGSPSLGSERDRLICRLYIHQSADVDSAQRFWLDVTGLEPEQFGRPTMKRHRPTTARKNTGDDYHGCLRIDVRRGADLYRRIEGSGAAAMAGSHPEEAADEPPAC